MRWLPLFAACSRSLFACCSDWRNASELSQSVITIERPLLRSKSPRKPFASGTDDGPASRTRWISWSVRLASRPSKLAMRAYMCCSSHLLRDPDLPSASRAWKSSDRGRLGPQRQGAGALDGQHAAVFVELGIGLRV